MDQDKRQSLHCGSVKYLPVPVLRLDVVGEGLGLLMGRVAVVVVAVVVVWPRGTFVSKCAQPMM